MARHESKERRQGSAAVASPLNQINDFLTAVPRREGGFSLTLLLRLVVAAVLLALALMAKMPTVFRVIVMILSAGIASYDLVVEMVDAVYEGDYFAPSVLYVLIAVLAFVIGYGWEGALLMILYQLGSALIDAAAKRSRRSAQELIDRRRSEFAEKASVLIEDAQAGDTAMEAEVKTAMTLLIKVMIAIALVFAVAMPIFTELSVRASIHRALIILCLATPTSVLVAMPVAGVYSLSYATHFGTLIKNARILERLAGIQRVVVDKNGIFSDDKPQFVGVKSDVLDEKTFMEFVAHALYYSDQPFAKAILAAEDREYRLDLISDFHDIPGSGVDVTIGGSKVTLAKRELLADRGEAVPYEGKAEGNVYYLMVSDKYIGKVLLTDHINQENAELFSELKSVGVQNCVLLTDDSRDESEKLGTQLNADEVYAEFSDETKLRYLEQLDNTDTLYLYTNSLEMHSSAAVDVRMSNKGKYADALVDPDALKLFPGTIMISQRLRQIMTENAVFAFFVKAILVVLALTGRCTIWFAIFLDCAAALATILNSIRITKNPLFHFPSIK